MTAATELEPTRPVPNQFTVTIAGDVPPGMYEVRAWAASACRIRGCSSWDSERDRRGGRQQRRRQGAGSARSARPSAAASRPAPTTIFRLNLKQGERVLIDLAARRIDSRLDGTLVLLAPTAASWPASRTASAPIRCSISPRRPTGAYLLKLNDAVYGGGDDYFYRLTVSAAPFVDFVFPPSGPAGSNNQYTLYGRNLPGGQPADGLTMRRRSAAERLQVNIPLPADDAAQSRLAVERLRRSRRAWQDGIEFRLPTPSGPANPVSDLSSPRRRRSSPEQEPNNDGGAAQKIAVPCEFAGQFYPQRDVDWVAVRRQEGPDVLDRSDLQPARPGQRPGLRAVASTKNDKGEEQLSEVAQVDDQRTSAGGGSATTSTPRATTRRTSSSCPRTARIA